MAQRQREQGFSSRRAMMRNSVNAGTSSTFLQREKRAPAYEPINKEVFHKTPDGVSQFQRTKFLFHPREMPKGRAWPHTAGEDPGNALRTPRGGGEPHPPGLKFTQFLWGDEKNPDQALKPRRRAIHTTNPVLNSYQEAFLARSTKPPHKNLNRGKSNVTLDKTKGMATRQKPELVSKLSHSLAPAPWVKPDAHRVRLHQMMQGSVEPPHLASHKIEINHPTTTWSDSEPHHLFVDIIASRKQKAKPKTRVGIVSAGVKPVSARDGLLNPVLRQLESDERDARTASAYVSARKAWRSSSAREDLTDWKRRMLHGGVTRPHTSSSNFDSINFAASLDYDEGLGSFKLSPRAYNSGRGGGGSLSGLGTLSGQDTPYVNTIHTQQSLPNFHDPFPRGPGQESANLHSSSTPLLARPVSSLGDNRSLQEAGATYDCAHWNQPVKGPVRHFAGYVGPAPRVNCNTTPDTMSISQVEALVPNNTRPQRPLANGRPPHVGWGLTATGPQ